MRPPYRCFVPQEIEQLLVTGRYISVVHIAHGHTRNMPAWMAGGQAVGRAAALAIRNESTVRGVDMSHVQELVQGISAPIRTHQLAWILPETPVHPGWLAGGGLGKPIA
jgi:hypothetical protein